MPDEAREACAAAIAAGLTSEIVASTPRARRGELEKLPGLRAKLRNLGSRAQRLQELADADDHAGLVGVFETASLCWTDDESMAGALVTQQLERWLVSASARRPEADELEAGRRSLLAVARAADAVHRGSTFIDFAERGLQWSEAQRRDWLDAWSELNALGSAVRGHRFAHVIDRAQAHARLGEALGDPLLQAWAHHAVALAALAALNYRQIPSGRSSEQVWLAGFHAAKRARELGAVVGDVDVEVDALGYLLALVPYADQFVLEEMRQLHTEVLRLRNRLPYGAEGIDELERDLARAVSRAPDEPAGR